MVFLLILSRFLAGGRCSPRKEEVPDGDIVMGRVYPTKDPAESLFDYRVASDANKKLALGAISASRCVEAPSCHRRDSWPSHDDVGGFFSEFEAFRTVSSEYDAPHRLYPSNRANQYLWIV